MLFEILNKCCTQKKRKFSHNWKSIHINVYPIIEDNFVDILQRKIAGTEAERSFKGITEKTSIKTKQKHRKI